MANKSFCTWIFYFKRVHFKLESKEKRVIRESLSVLAWIPWKMMFCSIHAANTELKNTPPPPSVTPCLHLPTPEDGDVDLCCVALCCVALHCVV